MKVLIFSDIHGDLRALERIVEQPADIYIAAGDLSNFGKGLDRCGEILKLVDFHRQVRSLKSASATVQWAGLGYSNITPFNTPGEYSEKDIAEALAAFEGIKSLHLVAHFPPFGTKLDEFAPGKHAGSPTLRAWVERTQPAYLFCGHIHETAGLTDRIGATQCLNVGKQGYVLEV